MVLHKGSLTVVNSTLIIRDGQLTNCPTHVEGYFWYDLAGLTSLVGGPVDVGQFYQVDLNNLTDLDGVAPFIGTYCSFEKNDISSLCGIHKRIKRCTSIWARGNPIVEGGLGVFAITGCREIQMNSNEPLVCIIMHKYLAQHIDGDKSAIFKCQKELVDNGFEEFAKL